MTFARCVSLLLAAVCLLAGCRGRPEAGDEIWAEVNGQPIYRAQVEKFFAQRTRNIPEPFSPAEAQAFKLRVLGELIENEILWQKAAQAGVQASDNEVETRFQELRSSLSSEEFGRQLSQQQMTPEELKDMLRRDIAIQKLLDQYLGRRIEVNPNEVAQFYQQHKNEFRFVETHYRVAYILVTPGQEPEVRNLRNDDAVGDAAARRKADMIVERLRSGDDFSEMAQNLSEDEATALQGGEMGFFPESALANTPAPLRVAVTAMEPGQLVGPIRTDKGYYIVKLLERQPAGQRELSDPQVQQAVQERLRRQKRQLLEVAFTERARNQAHVVNHLARQILEANRVGP
ncbi:MAG TPA: SurA N-terminal domain-containing protein [Candidatus Xenobia bacterium]|nr:SurA N-terminal domain-containing protein [Candidatus Xenobia bacterium]